MANVIDDGTVAWVDDHLRAAGRTRTGALTVFRERAWSTIASAPTDHGTVWLKICPPDNAFEVALYEVLADVVPESVLVPLGADPALGWVLLPDGGPTARERAAGDRSLEVAAMGDALAHYARLQQSLAPHADRMLAAGVADMTPSALPAVFDRAVEVVRPYVELHPAERPRFERVLAARDDYLGWCAQLEAIGRPATIDHNDLHSANVLDGPRFYDWGDSVLAHPFAALLVPVNGEEPADGARLRDRYLAEWGTPRELWEEAELAMRVACPPRALVWHRALAPDPLTHEHAEAPLYWLEKTLSLSP